VKELMIDYRELRGEVQNLRNGAFATWKSHPSGWDWHCGACAFEIASYRLIACGYVDRLAVQAFKEAFIYQRSRLQWINHEIFCLDEAIEAFDPIVPRCLMPRDRWFPLRELEPTTPSIPCKRARVDANSSRSQAKEGDEEQKNDDEENEEDGHGS
jgi:hypothetical protein